MWLDVIAIFEDSFSQNYKYGLSFARSMINCPVCNSLLDEMGHPQVKCPHCGTIIDTQLSPGALGSTPSPYTAPPGYAPQGPGQIPTSYIAPPGVYGIQTIQHAGLLKRFIAWFIDAIILFIVAIPISLIVYGSTLFNSSSDLTLYTSTEGIIYSIITLAISLGYFIYLEATRQQTIGKMAMDIIVVKEDLTPIGMDESLRRNGLRILYQIPIIFLIIDAILIASDEQRIGDKVAHTYVVEKNFFDFVNSQTMMPPPPQAPPQAPPPPRPDDY